MIEWIVLGAFLLVLALVACYFAIPALHLEKDVAANSGEMCGRGALGSHQVADHPRSGCRAVASEEGRILIVGSGEEYLSVILNQMCRPSVLFDQLCGDPVRLP